MFGINIHICFPIKIKKTSDNTAHIDNNLITVDNFFAHWIKEVSITKYGTDKELPPTSSPWEVYQYLDQLLKHMPTNALKTIQKTHLFSRKPIYFADTSYEKRNYNDANVDFTGLSTAERTTAKKKSCKRLEDRIPLRYISDIGKINFRTKIDYRIKLFIEIDMGKLFESRKPLAANAAMPEPEAQIIFTKAQYEQILLDKNFRQHLETTMVSKKILRMGDQKTPIQKTYEI